MAPCSSRPCLRARTPEASAFQHLMLEAEFAFTFREPADAPEALRTRVLAAIDVIIRPSRSSARGSSG
jgi:hypothetical protein